MRVITVPLGAQRTNSYIVGDETSRQAILIDPVRDADALLAVAESNDLRIGLIVCTHGHAGHVGGVAEAKARLGVPFLFSAAGVAFLRSVVARQQDPALTQFPNPDRLVRQDDSVALDALHFVVLDTPGHSQGDIALYAPEQGAVFSGDTIFLGRVGRVGPDSDEVTLLRSIRERLLTLPDETVVYPGHGPTTTIGYERRHNPALHG